MSTQVAIELQVSAEVAHRRWTTFVDDRPDESLDGSAIFESLDDASSRLVLQVEQNQADARANLRRFKEIVESPDDDPGDWRATLALFPED